MSTPDRAWMRAAERAARALGASTAGHAGARHAVYVVLLRDPARGGRRGLYVGQTSRDPDWQFDQYKGGYKVSDAVPAARARMPAGESAAECVSCGEPIPERRRLALPGVRTCVACQAERDARPIVSGINRRGSKDSQLR